MNIADVFLATGSGILAAAVISAILTADSPANATRRFLAELA